MINFDDIANEPFLFFLSKNNVRRHFEHPLDERICACVLVYSILTLCKNYQSCMHFKSTFAQTLWRILLLNIPNISSLYIWNCRPQRGSLIFWHFSPHSEKVRCLSNLIAWPRKAWEFWLFFSHANIQRWSSNMFRRPNMSDQAIRLVRHNQTKLSMGSDYFRNGAWQKISLNTIRWIQRLS